MAWKKTNRPKRKAKPKTKAKPKAKGRALMPKAKAGARGAKFPPEILTDEEATALLQACSRQSPTGVRNRALIAVYLGTGVRCEEALDLRMIDIDLERGSVHVMRGKRSKDRTIGISAGAVAILEQWLAVRVKLKIPATAPMFCTLKTRAGTRKRPWSSARGGKLSTAYVRAMLPKLAVKAGILRRVHAHMFRHTFAANALRRGINIGKISKQLGHASIAVTAEYLDHIDPVEVIDAIGDLPWGFGE